MARISGVELPNEKRTDIGLTAIYGIGRVRAALVLGQAKVDASKKVKVLTADEVTRIQKVIEAFAVEGDLRRQIKEDIERLKTIGSYRGVRHSRGLPVRGQRTRSNARTRRGRRKTIGALKKDDMAKVVQSATAAEKK